MVKPFYFAAVLLLSISAISHAQSFSTKSDNKTIFEKAQSGKTQTIIINVAQYSPNLIGLLKDELITYQEKVTNVTYNEINTHFSFTYNEHMLKEDLIEVFKKHGINYYKSDAKLVTDPNNQTN